MNYIENKFPSDEFNQKSFTGMIYDHGLLYVLLIVGSHKSQKKKGKKSGKRDSARP